jgi:hypothetical protein
VTDLPGAIPAGRLFTGHRVRYGLTLLCGAKVTSSPCCAESHVVSMSGLLSVDFGVFPFRALRTGAVVLFLCTHRGPNQAGEGSS